MPDRVKILIAEDDPVSTRILTKSLQDLGYDVIAATDGRAAFEQFRREPTSIIISDWMMPGWDGLSFCQDVRKLNLSDYTHFILLTARVDRDSYRRAMAAGVDDFLTKPLNREDLAIRLRVAERVVLQRRDADARIRILARFAEENQNPVLQVSRDGKIIYSNQASRALLAQWAGKSDEGVPPPLRELLIASWSGRPNQDCEMLSGGREYSFSATSIGADGTAYLYGHDITARKEAERAILELEHKAEHLALHDGLTDLPKRLLFTDRVDVSLSHARRNKTQAALLMIDLDNFKTVNDALGHSTGDRVLRLLAGALRQALPEGGAACRWGDDEFAVILPDLADVEAARTACDNLQKEFKFACSAETLVVPLSLSIGFAMFPQDADQTEHLLQRAEEALEQAKDHGRNCWRAYVGNSGHGSKAGMLVRLTEAIERKEIVFHYHPIINARSGLPVGLEALARWPDAKQGFISPDVFIPLAEEKGLIRKLGRDLLQQGLKQLRLLQDGGAMITLSLNVAPAQLTEPDFAHSLIQFVEAQALHPSSIILEIIERQSVLENEVICRNLEVLAATGFRLSLDDFGTGYSSLDLIGALPFQELKIHRGLVCQVENSRPRRLVQAVVEMAKALGLATVAEGVATESVLKILQDIGVNKIQGFLFARPMPADELGAYLARVDWAAAGATLERRIAPHISSGLIGL